MRTSAALEAFVVIAIASQIASPAGATSKAGAGGGDENSCRTAATQAQRDDVLKACGPQLTESFCGVSLKLSSGDPQAWWNAAGCLADHADDFSAACRTAFISACGKSGDNCIGASPELVAARQKFFGVENVDARTGVVDRENVLFSWLTNATLAASIHGRVILLDTYVHRAETVPGRTPFVVEDLVSLKPEALFLGHGHFDHADNAAFISGKLKIPIYASAETCIDMQTDAKTLFSAGTIDASQVDCRDVTTSGSEPGAEVVSIPALEPVASITAFRHLHSGTSYPETGFPITPVKNIPDPRDADMYPPGTPHSFPAAKGAGGPVAIYYQFVVHGGNEFTFVWHNTTGDLQNGCTIDRGVPNCWGPRVAKQVESRIRALPPTDLEFGSFVSLGYAVNGMRDPIQNSAALQPKIYVPIHQTNAAQPTSSLYFKVAYLKQLDQMKPALKPSERPEPRWMVDPDDYLKPMIFEPRDPRWAKSSVCEGDHKE